MINSETKSFKLPEGGAVVRGFLQALLLTFAVLALVVFCAWLLPYGRLKVFLSAAVAVRNSNGNVTHPTEHGVDALLARLPFAFALFAACAAALAVFRRRLELWLLPMAVEWRTTRQSLREFFPSSAETRWECAAMAVLCAVGLFLRLWHLRRGMQYDEASTYLFFVSQPIYRALSNYSYPNNHLLYTLLAFLSIRIFGDTAVALRIPALLAGWMCIPAAWLAARALYGRLAGILTAGCVAALPTFLEFSVNARGYSLQWLCILCMMICAVVLQARPSLRLAWLVFAVSGVAGLYCIPTMLIPAGAIAVCMLLSAAIDGGMLRFKEFLARLGLAGLAMVLLSALLYLPPLLASGPLALVGNQFVAPRATPFVQALGPLLHATWRRWAEGVPTFVTWTLAAGAVIGLLLHRKVSSSTVPMTAVLWAGAFVFAWTRNIVGYPRVWSFLLLAAVMTASGGIAQGIKLISPHSQSKQILLAGAVSVLLAVIIGASLIQERLLFRNNETVALIDGPQVVKFLRKELVPGNALVVTSPATPIIEYELLHEDPKLYTSLTGVESADRVIAVVAKPDVASDSYGTNELLARLAAEDAVDPSLASAQMDLSSYNPPQLLRKFLSATVYSFDRRPSPRQSRSAK